MSYGGSYQTPSSPPVEPPPPPPPKPYSHDPGRAGTPITSPPPPPPHQPRYSQQYNQPPLPPHPSQVQSPPPTQAQHPGAPLRYQTHPAAQTQQYQSSSPQPPPAGPTLPATFELPESITKHTTPDLSKLLSDPTMVSALAQQHPAYAASLQPLQAQIASNLALSHQVSSLEAQVQQLREQTGQLMLQHTSLQTQWRRKQTEMDGALAPWGPRAMYQRLVASIGEQESLLRAVYESFLEGGSDGSDYYGGVNGKASEKEVTDWVKRIREGTSVLEKRREMRARWDEGRVGGWR